MSSSSLMTTPALHFDGATGSPTSDSTAPRTKGPSTGSSRNDPSCVHCPPFRSTPTRLRRQWSIPTRGSSSTATATPRRPRSAFRYLSPTGGSMTDRTECSAHPAGEECRPATEPGRSHSNQRQIHIHRSHCWSGQASCGKNDQEFQHHRSCSADRPTGYIQPCASLRTEWLKSANFRVVLRWLKKWYRR